MEVFVKVFLPVYILSLVLITYVFNIQSFKKKYGKDPRVVKKNDPVMHVLQTYIYVIYLTTVLIIVIFSFLPHWYEYTMPITYLKLLPLQIIGLVLLLVSLFFVRAAQLQLKESYRIGIDRSDQKTNLITSGIYSKSRNPISLGLFLITIGMFLIIPNLITFTTANLTWFLIHIRVRTEEEDLLNKHGDNYLKYKEQTPRWF